MKKYLLTGCFLAILTLIQLSYSWIQPQTKLVFCDVGQGDAVLITRGKEQILVDGGRGSQAVLSCLAKQLPFWDRQLELVVATHADADHIGGLPAVLRNYQVKRFLSSRYPKNSQLFAELKEELAKEVKAGMVLENPFLGRQLDFPQEKCRKTSISCQLNDFFMKKMLGFTHNQPSMRLSILSPQGDESLVMVQNRQNSETILSDVDLFFNQALPDSVSYNELSIVLNLELGQTTVLLTGDIDQASELSLLKRGLLKKTDILKVAHHGSKSSTNSQFLQAIDPEISVISVGAKNPYGHPAAEVLDLLSEFEVKTLRTDREGTVVITFEENGNWQLAQNKSKNFFLDELLSF